MSRARILADYVSSGDELADKLSLSGGVMTGAITTNSTFDGVDVATRDATLTSTTTLATAAAPKASPTFTGTVAIPNVANLETAVAANTAKVSGSTNASDLASGTLAIARFPAGSVVKTTYNQYHGANADVTTSGTLERFNVSGTFHYKGTITDVGASNHVLGIMSCQTELYKASSTYVGASLGIMRDTDGAGANEATLIESVTHANYYGAFSSAAINMYLQLSIHFIDEAPATGTNFYYLCGKTYSGSAFFLKSTGTYEPFRCTLMEIQR